MSGPFTKLLNIAVSTVKLPIAVASDVLTLGGLATDKETTYTEETLREVAINLDELIEDE